MNPAKWISQKFSVKRKTKKKKLLTWRRCKRYAIVCLDRACGNDGNEYILLLLFWKNMILLLLLLLFVSWLRMQWQMVIIIMERLSKMFTYRRTICEANLQRRRQRAHAPYREHPCFSLWSTTKHVDEHIFFIYLFFKKKTYPQTVVDANEIETE